MVPSLNDLLTLQPRQTQMPKLNLKLIGSRLLQTETRSLLYACKAGEGDRFDLDWREKRMFKSGFGDFHGKGRRLISDGTQSIGSEREPLSTKHVSLTLVLLTIKYTFVRVGWQIWMHSEISGST
jgi:hypothetical protein